MLHEALMLEIYRQALNAGALPTARPRSTESANSSERCPSHESNSSETGGGGGGNGGSVGGRDSANNHHHHHQQQQQHNRDAAAAIAAAAQLGSTTFPAVPQTLPAQPPSMEAYLHMVAAAAQQYGFPLGAAAAAAAGSRLPLPLPNEATAPFKLPPQASPTASSNNSEALDFRTNLFGRAASAEPPASEGEDDDYDDIGGDGDGNNPLDLSVGTRKRSADTSPQMHMGQDASSIGQIQVKKMFKTHISPHEHHHADSPPNTPSVNAAAAAAAAAAATSPLLPGVNPYLAAVAAANIFRSGQFPDWNGKTDLVVDPLEKMSDIVKGPRKETKSMRGIAAAATSVATTPTVAALAATSNTLNANANNNSSSSNNNNNNNNSGNTSNEGVTKARHNIWQSHWQNKGVASSVFRCVWCKQSFATLEALTAHMKDSKHCGVNVPPFSNLPSNNERHHHHHHQQQQQQHQPNTPTQSNQLGGAAGNAATSPHGHNLRKQNNSGGPSQAAKNAFQYRGDPPTPLPRKLVRGQNVWLGKGVEQAMQILKCMRCGESFRSLGEMTKHMQETQHYTNILSQEQTISMKGNSNAGASSGGGGGGGGAGASGDAKDTQNSLSSEESRTLSAVLTCKVCDKAFNSLGDLSNHMAKNNHYAEPLMQSLSGAAGNRKRPAPKKREKSLPVRKLLEMKGAQNDGMDAIMESKLARASGAYESSKRMSDGTGLGPSGDKSDAALFAERMRQYITGVKSPEDSAAAAAAKIKLADKSPELTEPKNGTTKANTAAAAAQASAGGGSGGSSSVLSAIEQMFTTSFDTPPRHATLPATSPSNSSTKNTSPVASSILKRLGIDESVDYNKPLIDTSDPYYQHYRYTSSERSGSECSAETHVEQPRKMTETPQTPEKMQIEQELPATKMMEHEIRIKREREESMPANAMPMDTTEMPAEKQHIKMEIKEEINDAETAADANNQQDADKTETFNGGIDYSNNNNSNNNNNERSTPGTPGGGGGGGGCGNKSSSGASSPRILHAARSPTDDGHRSLTPKSPTSSIKSYDGGDNKKYPSDSLNALSSMFDSLGSTSTNTASAAAAAGGTTAAIAAAIANRTPKLPTSESPENLSTSNSLAALRQFCVKKEKTA